MYKMSTLDPRGGGVLWILSDSDDRMRAKIKTQRSLDQKLTPQISQAECASRKNFQKALNDKTQK